MIEPPGKFTVRYTITPEQIPGFLEGLRQQQESMIEAAVKIKQDQGFPEVRDLLNKISGA